MSDRARVSARTSLQPPSVFLRGRSSNGDSSVSAPVRPLGGDGDDDDGGGGIGKPSGPRGAPERIVGGSGDGSGSLVDLIVSSCFFIGSGAAEVTVGDDGIGAVTMRRPDARRRVGTASMSRAITGTAVARSHRGPPGGQTQQSGGRFPARIASATALAVSGPMGGPSIR